MFRFTIRGLVLLTLVAAMSASGCGRKAKAIREGMDAVDKHAAAVEEASRPAQ